MEYKKHGDFTKPYMFTLRKNYRCHEAILAIPRQLFYRDNLECAASKDVTLHPDAPYPLLFVCSSLTRECDANTEARVLLDQVAQFVMKSCPWSTQDIAIVTTTQTQIVTTRTLFRNHASVKDMKFNMLTTYKIQGQEFQALFWSTIEPISSDGNSFNPTKSPCDPFVFNTVLTRARSLVVAVGSPLALLDIEKHMVKLYGERGKCWSVYIRNCLEKNTFIIPKSVEQNLKVQKDFRRNLWQEIRAKEIQIQTPTDRKQPATIIMPFHQASSQRVETKEAGQRYKTNTSLLSLSQPSSKTQATDPPSSFAKARKQPEHVCTTKSDIIKSKESLVSIHSEAGDHYGPKKSSTSGSIYILSSEKKMTNIPDRQTIKYKEDYPTPSESFRVKAEVPKERILPNIQVPILRSAYYEKHKDELDDELLKEPELTTDNYKKKFHHLLCVEEEAHHVLLQERCNGEYEVTFYQSEKGFNVMHEMYHKEEFVRYGCIDVSTIGGYRSADNLSYAKQASQGSFIFLNDGSETVIKAKHILFARPPTKANFNAINIVFGLTKNEAQKLKQIRKGVYTFKTGVMFELKHSYFNSLHNALENLPETIVNKLLPGSKKSYYTLDRPDCIPGVTQQYSRFSNKLHLDQSGQMQALNSILKSSCDVPILIAGPFGTGKTRLLARTTFELLKVPNSHVLVCAHHQASVNTFMDYFVEMKKNGWGVNLVRVVPHQSYISKLKQDHRRFCKVKNNIRSLTKFKLVVTTLGTAPALARNVYPHSFFTHILIDEGAQTREPETIGPLCLANRNTKIVIAGDHLQVGPKLLVLGDKAQSNGLGTSLLERLHEEYEKPMIGNTANVYSLSLLTNHRCHSVIVTLASSLFYDSTIQFDVSEDVAHPLAEYPLQFICSDFEDIDNHQKRTEADNKEAKCLLDTVDKFVKVWPSHMSTDDDSKINHGRICIMSSSANQCHHLKTLLRSHPYRHLLTPDLDIRPVYEIQGCEYQAIFIGTTEITSKNGKSLNPLKSVCDPFVFNTAITRSKSLVVAVGNPFLLLSIEGNIDKASGKCWSQYMKRCLECNTFYIKNRSNIHNFSKLRDKLYKAIFKPKETETYCLGSGLSKTPKKNDSILCSYKKALKTHTLQLSQERADIAWKLQHISDSEPKHEHHNEDELIKFKDEYPCVLKALSFHEGEPEFEAIPTEPEKEIIRIKGRNRLNAFNGDTVLVGVLDDSSKGRRYGRVKEVLKRESTYNRFVCQVSPVNPVMFHPIENSEPTFINLPYLCKKSLSKKSTDEIEGYLKSEDAVVVFSPDSLKEYEDQEIPQIQQVLPLSVAKNMLFIMSFLKWKPKYRLPLGMVIGALPKGTTVLRAENLLKVVYGVEYTDHEDNVKFPAGDAQLDPTLVLYDQAITIDTDSTQHLDEALSLNYISSNEHWVTYKLGVHITNVAKYIELNSKEDKLARERGSTVYGGQEGKIMHMLSLDTHNKLSLFPNHVRDVISVVTKVTMTIHGESVDISDPEIKLAQVKSAIQLTYSNVQELLEDREPSDATMRASVTQFNFHSSPQLTLSSTIKNFYKIACHLQKERLSKPATILLLDDDNLKDVHFWQPHMLIEELLIWANAVVGTKTLEQLNYALLRHQSYPREEGLNSFLQRHENTLSLSHNLKHMLPSDSDKKTLPLVVSQNTLHELEEAISSRDIAHLTHLITSDWYYPQLAAAKSELLSIYPKPEFCYKDAEDVGPTSYHHSSLCNELYTHFSSPLSSYFDIMVQRMVLKFLGREVKSPLPTGKDCHTLNHRSRDVQQFETSMANINFAFQLTSSSEIHEAFVSCVHIEKKTLELLFPKVELRYIPQLEREIKMRHIGPFKKSSTQLQYQWRIRMTSMNEELGVSVLNKCCNIEQDIKEENSDDCSIKLEVFYEADSEEQTLNTKYYAGSFTPLTACIPAEEWKKVFKFVEEPNEQSLCLIKAVLSGTAHTPTKKLYDALLSIPGSPCPVDDVIIDKDICEKTDEIFPSYHQYQQQTQTRQSIPPLHGLCLKPDNDSPFLDYVLNLNIKPNEVLKVWMTRTTQRAWITPTVQMVELSPNVRICVQHNANPAKCFSGHNLPTASRKYYSDIQEYVRLWEKVLIAEAAVSSVEEAQPIIIQDVSLEWPKLHIKENCIDETYYTTQGGSVVLNISSHFYQNCWEFFQMNVGDLICARYGTDPSSKTRAVFHMVVHEVKPYLMGQNSVHMKFVGDNNCRISEEMKELLYTSTCELQLIPLSESYQRVYSRLLQLACDTKSLVSQIALGISEKEHGLMKVPTQLCDKTKEIFSKNSCEMSLWKESSESISKTLNESQRNAIKLALEHQYQLIQGPPGTGKSEIGAVIAYIFAMANRELQSYDSKTKRCVLYCGPSNKSVDVVLEKLDEVCMHNHDRKLNILRIYGRAVERQFNLGPYYKSSKCFVSDSVHNIKPRLKQYALHEKLRETQNELVHFEKTLPKNQIISARCCTKYKEVLLKAEEDFLHSNYFDVILCTCSESASGRMKHIFPRQCIIDECGMAHEPETMAPISLCEHITLIGDHKQLQPVVKYFPARQNALTTSLFERYAEKFTGFTVTLETQYRMHEEICAFPSKHFYGGKLKTDESVKNQTCPKSKLEGFWPQGDTCPILFCNVVGKEEQNISDDNETSTFAAIDSKLNKQEAVKVMEIVLNLVDAHNVNPKEIAVLTPYTAQKNEIVSQMKKTCDLVDKAGNTIIKVATITESQGEEYGIVILSTVRSQSLEDISNKDLVQPDHIWLRENLGFLTDKHQMNVGITRSKYGLAIVGNKMLLEYDSSWRELIDHYAEKKSIVEGSHFPDVEKLHHDHDSSQGSEGLSSNAMATASLKTSSVPPFVEYIPKTCSSSTASQIVSRNAHGSTGHDRGIVATVKTQKTHNFTEIANTTIKLTSEADYFEWKEYGFKLRIPQGCLPKGINAATISLSVFVSENYIMPDDHKLVSGIYSVNVSCELCKPVEMEIQHCANVEKQENCSLLSFVCAQGNLETSHIHFTRMSGGEFEIGNSYGKISQQKFSFFAIVWRKIEELFWGIDYSAHVYISRSSKPLEVHFIVIKKLDICLNVVKERYPSEIFHEEYTSFSLIFECDKIEFQIPEDRQLADSEPKWKLTPKFDPKLSRCVVDQHEKYCQSNFALPKCVFVLKWCSGRPMAHLDHNIKMEFTGAKDIKYFTLIIDNNIISDSQEVCTHKCDGQCGYESCTESFDSIIALETHIEEKQKDMQFIQSLNQQRKKKSKSKRTSGTSADSVDIENLHKKCSSFQCGLPRQSQVSLTVRGVIVSYPDPAYRGTVTKIEKEKSDIYDMKVFPHGVAVIISNQDFGGTGDRKGNEVDRENLCKTFQYLGYHVYIYQNCTANEMISIFENEIPTLTKSDHDSFICCVLSHGKENDMIHGTDRELVKLGTERGIHYDNLNSNKCPQLKGKPKLFFIQACRGGSISRDDTSSVEIPAERKSAEYFERPGSISECINEDDSGYVHPLSDFHVSMATVAGEKSWRNREYGTWYVTELCKVLCQKAPHMSLEKMIKCMHDAVSRYADKDKVQRPCVHHTLNKDVYFFGDSIAL